MDTIIETADSVLYKPTGERWLVAYADYERNEIAWCGWPPGLADISDCELKEKATDKQRASLLIDLSKMRNENGRGDPRKAWAVRELEKRHSITAHLKSGLDEAEEKAWKALAGYKFQMFGYWAAIWVHLNRISGEKNPNPFGDLVRQTRERLKVGVDNG